VHAIHATPSSTNINPFTADLVKALHFARLSASARMSEIKNDGLDQYGAKPFEQRQFGSAGVERVKWRTQQIMVLQTTKRKIAVEKRLIIYIVFVMTFMSVN